MVLPREEFLGAITILDEDHEGSIWCSRADVRDFNWLEPRDGYGIRSPDGYDLNILTLDAIIGPPGNITVKAGNGTGSQDGGEIFITGGDGVAGGDVFITGGDGDSEPGGSVVLESGTDGYIKVRSDGTSVAYLWTNPLYNKPQLILGPDEASSLGNIQFGGDAYTAQPTTPGINAGSNFNISLRDGIGQNKLFTFSASLDGTYSQIQTGSGSDFRLSVTPSSSSPPLAISIIGSDGIGTTPGGPVNIVGGAAGISGSPDDGSIVISTGGVLASAKEIVRFDGYENTNYHRVRFPYYSNIDALITMEDAGYQHANTLTIQGQGANYNYNAGPIYIKTGEQYSGNGHGSLRLYNGPVLNLSLEVNSTTASPKVGFLGHSAVERPTVTGSKGGNAALTSLLTALANLGLVTDSTT